MNLVDSSGWLEYFAEDKNASFFEKAIEDTENLIVSPINIYEVLKKLLQTCEEDVALQYIAAMQEANVVEINEEIALEAVSLSNHYKLPLADSLLYATSKVYDATFFTQDKHFENIVDVKYIKKEY